MESELMDQRRFRKLRISVTSSCNFGCVYCVHDGKAVYNTSETAPEQFAAWVKMIAAETPVKKIRITGGEPTLYSRLVPLVAALKELGDFEIAMTTNAYALAPLAADLKAAGLAGVNISLDAIDEAVFKSMGGKSLSKVLQGIQAAQDAGLEVKINTTLVNEMNDAQILPLLNWAHQRNIPLRFLELMDMGHLHGKTHTRLVDSAQILNAIATAHTFTPLPRGKSDTAHYFELKDGYRFGIIGNTSLPFCNDCDRLRLDSQGKVYGCLSSPVGFALDSAENITTVLEKAMQLKQPQKFTGSALVMREIGG